MLIQLIVKNNEKVRKLIFFLKMIKKKYIIKNNNFIIYKCQYHQLINQVIMINFLANT